MSEALIRAINEARVRASKLAVKYRTNRGVSVDVEKIATDLGIDVVRGSFNDPHGRSISGLLKIRGGRERPVIAIKEGESKQRQRFTIAHELGHFLLHKDDLLHVDEGNVEAMAFRDETSTRGTDIKEIQANQFAAELLMPSS